MKKTILAALMPFALGAMLISCTGCSNVGKNVPQTHFEAFIGGKPCSFTGPKDFKADLIKFTAETNGTVSLVISNMDARMNPEVITMTGEAYTKMQDANARAWKEISAGAGTVAGQAITTIAK